MWKRAIIPFFRYRANMRSIFNKELEYFLRPPTSSLMERSVQVNARIGRVSPVLCESLDDRIVEEYIPPRMSQYTKVWYF